ncbi:MAG: universal stress protein [Deltaproteobacteria bacterium]
MKNIVVGLDSSERAPAVLRSAFLLAQQFQAKLFVVRAASLPPEIPVEALNPAGDALPARLLEIAQQSVDQATSNVPREWLMGVEARLGTAWHVICEAAKEKHADLIVVGTHGFSGLDHILGTTAAKVVNHATCSVLVVRDEVK